MLKFWVLWLLLSMSLLACVGLPNEPGRPHKSLRLSERERQLFEQSSYQNYRDYGFVIGCRAALNHSREKPEAGWYHAPRLKGRYTDYLRQWRHGFVRCQD